MLPHHEPVLFQIGHVVWRLRAKLEEKPSDVGPEESLGNVVGIFLLIDMLVVPAVVRNPIQRRVFEGTGSEQQCGQPHRSARGKRPVGKQAVVSERNTHAGGQHIKPEKNELKGINAELPEVPRGCGD